MKYVFKDTGKDNGLANYPLTDEQDLQFVITCLAIRRSNAGLNIPYGFKPVTDVFVQLPFINTKNEKLILLAERIETETKVSIDASVFPDAVFSLSMILAGTGMEGEITGLERMSTGPMQQQITCLQRMLYRLNINTDYCGGSKLKVYNHKEMRSVLSLRPTNALFPSLMLIPAVIKTGELRIEIDEPMINRKMDLITAGGIEAAENLEKG